MKTIPPGSSARSAVAVAALSALLLTTAIAAEVGPASPAAAPRFDKWKIIGPGGGGGQFFPTISPHDPNTVLVRCDMTGSFITHDGGNSWRMFNLRSTSRFFVFDPLDPNTIYVRNIGLFRSRDAGKTWHLIHPDPDHVNRIYTNGDHGEVIIEMKEGPTPAVVALAVDPADSKTLYASISSSGSTGLFVSKDSGKTWQSLIDLPGGCRKIYVDPRSLPDARTLFIAGRNSVSVFRSGQLKNHPPPAGVRFFADISMGFPKGTSAPTVYAITPPRRTGETMSGGIYVSRTGGRTWRTVNTDLLRKMHESAPAPRLAAIATCLTQPDVAYLSYKNLKTGPDRSDSYLGVAKTTDAGNTWNLCWKDGEKPGDNIVSGWMNIRFGPFWGENPISLGVAPNNPDICYGTDYGRTMRTTNGGETWQAVYSKRWTDGNWTTTGLDVTTNYGVHFDPFEKNRIFISYTDIGLFSSDNGGSTWKSATAAGVPRRWVNTTYWMQFDPKVKGRVWAVMSGTHDLPRPKMWRGRGRVRDNGGVCSSEDGGRTWKTSTEGMPQTCATHIIMDPDSPTEARVLYVAGFGTGVWKSTDGGKTWNLKNSGIDRARPYAWWLARDKSGTLYLVVARKSESGELGNEDDGALYRSRDAAETWQKVPLPKGLNGPNGLSIDPDDPSRLYLAAWGRVAPGGAVTGGIWISTDAGKTWKHAFSKDQYIYDVTIDPRDPNLLYACGFGSAAWRSTDRGETWSKIEGFNFKWGHRVVPDPYNPDMVYITTFGGSVWYGPAAGDPDAVEDIVTPIAGIQ